MTRDQLRKGNWWDYENRLQAEQEANHTDDPDWIKDVEHTLINAINAGSDDDFNNILSWANADGALEKILFPEGSEPVTVTKTTTSVGGLPPNDIGGTPEEAEAMANNMLGEQPVEDHDDGYGGLANGIENAQTEEELQDILKAAGIELPKGEEGIEAPASSDPASDENLDKLDKQMDKSTEEPKKEEPKADKPAEEPKKEDKPADKPAEDKSDSKKEDKQEQSDTDRNIISTLSDLK